GERTRGGEAPGVAGGLQDRASALGAPPQLAGVHQVAVVGERERTAAINDAQRLGVLEREAAGRGVPVVADRELPRKPREGGLVVDVRDQPQALVAMELAERIAGDDAGGLLAAV